MWFFYFIVWRFYFDFDFSDGEFEFGYVKNCLGYFLCYFWYF
ncbi:hypothetical protein AO382_1956 [Moraxella catarrhalis]|uniref:Uncharacterized protein n=1 Tax=Moraxella catarrhalis TaxID=480 RepID=A0A7Z0UWZ7_MORCA|nr:hypothetical protein AO382_1956 [Moraxella catarrhalis]